MKTDAQIRTDVINELTWDASVRGTDVGVAVSNGVVTLSGQLESYADKHAAERAAQRVAGVRGVASELTVRLPSSSQRSDGEIAAAVRSALAWNTHVPHERLTVLVEKGWVTLSGEVDWDYQRQAARRAVQPLLGVTGVTSEIALKPRTTPENVRVLLQSALQRQAEREAKGIEVSVDGHTVTLRGKVHSLAERVALQGAAWSAPGITHVVNLVTVD